MDGSRFDTLTKTLAGMGSRRQTLGGLLVASLALLGGAQPEETAAHDAKKKCKKKSGDAKKKCLKKAKQHNASHTTPLPTEPTLPPGGTVVTPPPPPPPPPGSPAATCTDTVKNGSESDVDCGGPVCPRCAVGKACLGAADCSTSLCVNNVCTTCASGQCPSGCSCTTAGTGGICVSIDFVDRTVCADCPRYSYCFTISPTTVSCYPPCG